MAQLPSLGKVLIVMGIVLLVIGIILTQLNRLPFVGKLPGDILIRKGNFTFYFPVVTSILLSVVLTLIFYFINKLKR
ncbi:MAG: DUF2905 domain-containing protein [Chitinophagales bacterium]|nr:DUF2905 domain-containing protein [Chitinophagales bacterium]